MRALELLIDPLLWSSGAIVIGSYAACLALDMAVLKKRLQHAATPHTLLGRGRDVLTSLGKNVDAALSAVQYRLSSLEWQVDAQTEAKKSRARAETLVEIAETHDVPSSDSVVKLLLSQNEPRFRGSFLAVVLHDGEKSSFISVEDRGPAFNKEVTRWVNEFLTTGDTEWLGVKDARLYPHQMGGLLYFGVTSTVTIPFSWLQKEKTNRGVLFVAYEAPHVPTTIESKWAEELGAELQLRLTASTRIREAESQSKEKSDFLAHMSHDIRSPLNNIGNVLHLLRDDIKDHEQRELLDIAAANCTAMRDLIEAILDYSKLRAGKLEAEKELIDLKALVSEVSECYAIQARLRSLELSLTLPDEQTVRALIDGRQVKRVLSNLIGNAIKFTKEGGAIDVGLTVNEEDIRITVQDTGVGMSLEQVGELFSPFKRFHGASVDGIGLGLVLSKTLMELNGGDILVHSKVGVGTTFTVRIKQTDIAEERPRDYRQASSDEDPSVLVVDDDAGMVESLGKVLEREGYMVTRAKTVSEALGVMNFSNPKIVITDNHMPGGGGAAVLKGMRRIPEASAVVLTGSDDKGEIRELKALGAHAVLKKPVTKDEILHVLAGLTEPTKKAVG